MNIRNKASVLLLILLLVYNFSFWGEKIGLNLLIFLFLSSITMILLNDENLKSRNVILSLLASLYSSAMVVVNNSGFSVTAAFFSFAIFMGFIHQPKLKTVFSALLTSMADLIIFPYNVFIEIKYFAGRSKPVRLIFRLAAIMLIPAIVFTVFYSIYAYSNPVFYDYSVTFWDTIWKYIHEIFVNYPVLRFFYIFFGLILITGFIYNRNISAFAELDGSFLDFLKRDKFFKTHSRSKPTPKRHLLFEAVSYRFKPTTLKLETRIGIVLVVMTNALLLLLNYIDLNFTWLGFDTAKVDNLAYHVHNGTYLLIFSIMLSMAILLYFFRGSQNFFSGSKFLRYGAYLWIAQNAFMALSVVLRNLYYIEYYYALSYKRIGVMIFILLTLTGLVTMLLKISQKRTTYWLLKVNSTAAFCALLLMASFSWDKTIAEFNLSNPDKNKIDLEYLFRLSDDVLPVLDKNKDVINRPYLEYGFMFSDELNGLAVYKSKVNRFIREQQRYSWLSWNLPDSETMRYYSDQGIEKFLIRENPSKEILIDEIKTEPLPVPLPENNQQNEIRAEEKRSGDPKIDLGPPVNDSNNVK
jgi:hypothetical protein